MDAYRKCLRFGLLAIVMAMLTRLGAAAGEPLSRGLADPDFQSLLIYLETGRKVRFSPYHGEKSQFDGESAPPVLTVDKPCFSAADADAIKISAPGTLRPDLGRLLEKPLSWDLFGGEPKVLIIHTHTTESYTPSGEGYAETAAFRTLDPGYNMLSIGTRLAQALEAGGIGVIHDRTLHDYPSYNGSYTHARKSIRGILEEYPTIELVLDLHRDASGDLNNQIRPLALVEGKSAAQLMLVVGTDAGGQVHPKWQENLALAGKLQLVLEAQAPGITRPIDLRLSRFNQDLSTGALLIEVGAAGNTHPEALAAADILAKAILTLARGTETHG